MSVMSAAAYNWGTKGFRATDTEDKYSPADKKFRKMVTKALCCKKNPVLCQIFGQNLAFEILAEMGFNLNDPVFGAAIARSLTWKAEHKSRWELNCFAKKVYCKAALFHKKFVPTEKWSPEFKRIYEQVEAAKVEDPVNGVRKFFEESGVGRAFLLHLADMIASNPEMATKLAQHLPSGYKPYIWTISDDAVWEFWNRFAARVKAKKEELVRIVSPGFDPMNPDAHYIVFKALPCLHKIIC